VRGNSGFMAVKNDIPNGDGCGFDWHNGDRITFTYRRVHAVARSMKLYFVPFTEQFSTNFFKVIRTEI
jgi:hypothetical protein